MIIAASFDTTNPDLWINRGLSYGDGLFETMRFNYHHIPLLDFHLQRLSKGLKKLRLNEFDRSKIEEVIEKNVIQGRQAVVKLLVFRASQARTYMPLTSDIDWVITQGDLPRNQSNEALKLAVSAQKISLQPMLAGLKHLSRLEQVMLAAELNQHEGVDDLLVIDAKNEVIETSYQNVVMIKNNQLITPQLNQSGVKGVALEWLKSKHVVEERNLKIKDLNDCDGMMVCNSIRGFGLVDSVFQRGKQCISFGISHDIHDKITAQWDELFIS